jgi:hypothetical protein
MTGKWVTRDDWDTLGPLPDGWLARSGVKARLDGRDAVLHIGQEQEPPRYYVKPLLEIAEEAYDAFARNVLHVDAALRAQVAYATFGQEGVLVYYITRPAAAVDPASVAVAVPEPGPPAGASPSPTSASTNWEGLLDVPVLHLDGGDVRLA